MREAPPVYYEGLEFYTHPHLGLCGVENIASGEERGYEYLTDAEATAWLTAWLRGETWIREEPTAEPQS